MEPNTFHKLSGLFRDMMLGYIRDYTVRPGAEVYVMVVTLVVYQQVYIGNIFPEMIL